MKNFAKNFTETKIFNSNSAYGQSLIIADEINIEGLLHGKKSIDENSRQILKDQIRQKIIEHGVENYQEGIYRYMGDLCTEIVNSE